MRVNFSKRTKNLRLHTCRLMQKGWFQLKVCKMQSDQTPSWPVLWRPITKLALFSLWLSLGMFVDSGKLSSIRMPSSGLAKNRSVIFTSSTRISFLFVLTNFTDRKDREPCSSDPLCTRNPLSWVEDM